MNDRTVTADSVNMDNRNGFTLLEILIAMLIFGVTLTTLYSTYTGTIRNMEETSALSETYQKARVALERIVEDLESAYISPEETDSTSLDTAASAGFYGQDLEIDGRSSDNLRFNSTSHLSFYGDIEGPGRAKITYYVEENEDDDSFTLFRSDFLEFDTDKYEEGEGGLVLCDNLHSIDFSYLGDNGDIYNEWDSTSELLKDKMPSMVSITLEFRNGEDDEESLQKFTTSVAIPLVNENK